MTKLPVRDVDDAVARVVRDPEGGVEARRAATPSAKPLTPKRKPLLEAKPCRARRRGVRVHLVSTEHQ